MADPGGRTRRAFASRRRRCVSTFDGILRSRVFAASHRPEVVIRFGGLLASKVTNQWLASSGAYQVAIDRFGRSPDPDGVVAHSFTSEIAMACDQIVAASPDPAPDRWTRDWQAADAAARRRDRRRCSADPETRPSPRWPLDVVAMVPDEGTVVVSSSMPVRDVECVRRPTRAGAGLLQPRCQRDRRRHLDRRGRGPERRAHGSLTGDVAFLHDSNGLIGAGRRDLSMVVVVVDNDGGGIFHFLPQRDELPADQFEALFGTPHGVDIAATRRSARSARRPGQHPGRPAGCHRRGADPRRDPSGRRAHRSGGQRRRARRDRGCGGGRGGRSRARRDARFFVLTEKAGPEVACD